MSNPGEYPVLISVLLTQDVWQRAAVPVAHDDIVLDGLKARRERLQQSNQQQNRRQHLQSQLLSQNRQRLSRANTNKRSTNCERHGQGRR